MTRRGTNRRRLAASSTGCYYAFAVGEFDRLTGQKTCLRWSYDSESSFRTSRRHEQICCQHRRGRAKKHRSLSRRAIAPPCNWFDNHVSSSLPITPAHNSSLDTRTVVSSGSWLLRLADRGARCNSWWLYLVYLRRTTTRQLTSGPICLRNSIPGLLASSCAKVGRQERIFQGLGRRFRSLTRAIRACTRHQNKSAPHSNFCAYVDLFCVGLGDSQEGKTRQISRAGIMQYLQYSPWVLVQRGEFALLSACCSHNLLTDRAASSGGE